VDTHEHKPLFGLYEDVNPFSPFQGLKLKSLATSTASINFFLVQSSEQTSLPSVVLEKATMYSDQRWIP
jgi:hypothetical protein